MLLNVRVTDAPDVAPPATEVDCVFAVLQSIVAPVFDQFVEPIACPDDTFSLTRGSDVVPMPTLPDDTYRPLLLTTLPVDDEVSRVRLLVDPAVSTPVVSVVSLDSVTTPVPVGDKLIPPVPLGDRVRGTLVPV